MRHGTTLERIKRPSEPIVPHVAHAETILFTHTMLPIAPPMICIATINMVGRPSLTAAAYCSVENSVQDTVAEPEINAPITPMIGATMIYALPNRAARPLAITINILSIPLLL